MGTSIVLLLLIVTVIEIATGYQCRLYLYTNSYWGGSEYGPFDVGYHSYGAYPNDAISSMRIYAEGYVCHARLYIDDCGSSLIVDRTAGPFQMADDYGFCCGSDDALSCAHVWADATPKPTPHPSVNPTPGPSVAPSDATPQPTAHPSVTPTAAPSMPPTSSCIDYENKTNSDDGNNEIREFDEIYRHITDMRSHYINEDSVLEFNTSESVNYKNQLIECTVSDCVIQCHHTASCLKTEIEINNITNKTAILLCYDEYSCSGSSIVTKSLVTDLNVSVVCVGEYSCINAHIYLTNISAFSLYCLHHGSCLDVNITIESNTNVTTANDGIISCVSLNSCDNLLITTTSNKTQLIMYAFSEDVTLDNGAGYFYEDNNILCNNNRYLRYETNTSLQNNITDLILNEYDGQMWPCEGVRVLCGAPYSCNMEFEPVSPQFLPTLTSGCYWIGLKYFARLHCAGECVSSPTPLPTTSPTVTPTSPSNAPSVAPTIAPSFAPTEPPTANPSIAPSMVPSIAPSQTPSVSPTASPSITPTIAPSLAPTQAPTTAPTQAPTIAPTSVPTVAPSNIPTVSPTIAPTIAPSLSPSRFPTKKIEDIYPSQILITYVINDLTEESIELLEDYTTLIVPDIVGIIEANYFVTNDVEFQDFVINILNINEFEDLSNINLKQDQPVIMASQILSKSDIAGILVKKSKSTIFETDVTEDLRILFANNSDLYFEVQNADSLTYQLTDESENEQESAIMIIVLACIVLVGFLCSAVVKWQNGRKDGVVDNAKWIAPLLLALQIYDFISDINLTYHILTNPLAATRDIILWCGIFCGICTVVPFLSNLYYGITIKTQEVVRNNKRAESYFTDKMAIFIALIVSCGGCYPALTMVSSKIFNLDAFNSGLTKHELNTLSKIKIRSTITMENGPQLLISIIYAYNIGKVSDSIFLSFVASSLSVILAISSFYANKFSRKDAEIMMYDLKFYNENGDALTKTQKGSIKKKKGRQQELKKKLAAIFGSSHENIEIGSVTLTNYGFTMYVSHHIPRKDLAAHNIAYNSRYNKTKKSRMRMKMVVGSPQYLQHLYQKHSVEINIAMRMHFFEYNDEKFVVEFMIDNVDNAEDDSYYQLPGTQRTETIYPRAQTIYEVEGGNDNNNNVEMAELKHKVDQIYDNMTLLTQNIAIINTADESESDEEKEEVNELLGKTNFAD